MSGLHLAILDFLHFEIYFHLILISCVFLISTRMVHTIYVYEQVKEISFSREEKKFLFTNYNYEHPTY